MINGLSILAIIPARGGSKGVPLKNMRNFAGKPLLVWTIEAARGCPEIDRVILSSDHQAIMDIARHHGCEVPFVRPDSLADDRATAIDVAIHALTTLQQKFDYLVWLQPTSPLRTSEDIRLVLELLIHGQNDSCTSVCLAPKPPDWMFRLNDDHTLRPVLENVQTSGNRQALPAVYVLNGAVYACSVPWLIRGKKMVDNQTRAYVMDPHNSIDIDTELDFKLGELLMAHASLTRKQ